MKERVEFGEVVIFLDKVSHVHRNDTTEAVVVFMTGMTEPIYFYKEARHTVWNFFTSKPQPTLQTKGGEKL